jgi:MFS family permease
MSEQSYSTTVLWSSYLAMLANGANSTAIMAALPTMQADLSLSAAGVQWAVNAYLVVAAVCIVPGGLAADRFGAVPASIFGMALLAIATCIIGLAGDQTVVLAGRALQGFAAAFAVPSTLAVAGSGSSAERRSRAIAAWTGFLMLGFSIGPLVGGALTHYLGWRMVFWLIVPFILLSVGGLASAGLAAMSPGTTQRRHFDWLGFFLTAAFMVSLVLGLQAVPRAGTAPLSAIVPFAVAMAALILLLVVESRIKSPLVDLSFFKRRGFVMGVAIGSLSLFSIMGLLLYFNLYAQRKTGLDVNAIQSGLLLVPLSVALLALALSATAIATRVGLRSAMTGGMALLAIGSAIVGAAITGGGTILLLIGLAGIGGGLALPYALAPRLALSALSPEQTGQGSGIINACTFLSGSAGVACSGIAFAEGDFIAVLALIGAAAILGAALGCLVPKTT